MLSILSESLMQGGNDARLELGRQHGTGENGGGGMRHGVVNMKNIEVMMAEKWKRDGTSP